MFCFKPPLCTVFKASRLLFFPALFVLFIFCVCVFSHRRDKTYDNFFFISVLRSPRGYISKTSTSNIENICRYIYIFRYISLFLFFPFCRRLRTIYICKVCTFILDLFFFFSFHSLRLGNCRINRTFFFWLFRVSLCLFFKSFSE